MNQMHLFDMNYVFFYIRNKYKVLYKDLLQNYRVVLNQYLQQTNRGRMHA